VAPVRQRHRRCHVIKSQIVSRVCVSRAPSEARDTPTPTPHPCSHAHTPAALRALSFSALSATPTHTHTRIHTHPPHHASRQAQGRQRGKHAEGQTTPDTSSLFTHTHAAKRHTLLLCRVLHTSRCQITAAAAAGGSISRSCLRMRGISALLTSLASHQRLIARLASSLENCQF
jgi:hypothetical protein